MLGLEPQFICLVLAWLLLAGVVIAAGIRGKRLAEASYYQGFREGLEHAVDLVKIRASIARELAPAGEMPYAMIRAQMADQIEFDLENAKRLTNQVGGLS